MSKSNYKDNPVDPQDFNKIISKLREFFTKNGFIETFPQPKLTILAACEDPKTVKGFHFDGQYWPLPQTNQMNLEEELMVDKLDGLFCLTSSYRDEPNPVDDRHMKTFPMFEAEKTGDFGDLVSTISECCVHLGLVDSKSDIKEFKYDDLCKHYKTDTLTSEHEEMIWKEFGDVVAITMFPERTSPFFNMQFAGYNENNEKVYNKVDFIVCGQETFGCAARENDPKIMWDNFHSISDGEYSQLLFDKFGKDRVINELKDFLSIDMIDRWGFGMGVTRLTRAMKIKEII